MPGVFIHDDRITELLTLVVEESSEVVKERCKIERSGTEFVPFADQGKTATNLDNLKNELVQLHTVLTMLMEDEDFISTSDHARYRRDKLAGLRVWAPNIFKDN